jgi:hypothetical protein
VTPTQIEAMIDRICAMFPTVPVPKNGMKNLWKEDALLLAVDVKQGRAVMALVERHGTVPSLPELKRMFRSLMDDGKAKEVCADCNGTCWISGVPYLDDFTNKMVEGVIRCKCSS